MSSNILKLIEEINILWEPIFPYLSRQIVELYRRNDGNIIEIGPFCGLIFSLEKENIGDSFSIATFPSGMGNFFINEVKKRSLEDKIRVIETDPSLTKIRDESIDLAIFRGAFFFPSLFKVDLKAINRILRKNGLAFVGGGFGKFTPQDIIKGIGEKSRELNFRIGKVEISEDDLNKEILKCSIKGEVKKISEGGIWITIRKEFIP